MIKILSLQEAQGVWDKTILNLSNPIYYQSEEYADAYKEDKEINFIYSNNDDKKIYGFVKISDDEVTMPFGPIYSSNVTREDIMNYIMEISDHYNKGVKFTISNEMISEFEENYPNLEKVWFFVTPAIDTTLPIETIVKNSTENRRRIIKKGLINIPDDRIKEGREYLDAFYELYLRRMKETGGEVDFDYKTLESYVDSPNTHLVVCLDGDKVIASHIAFSFGKVMQTRYNCFDSAYSKISPAARIDYELIKRSCEDSNIEMYDMSGLAVGNDISEKLKGINRYKESYNPTIILKYQWYKYNK